MYFIRLAIVAMLSVLLLGCTSEEERRAKELQSLHHFIGGQVKQLETHLKAGRLRNATLLKRYADVLSQQKPELNPITSELVKDAGIKGPMYLSLVSRLQDAKQQIPYASQNLAATNALVGEFNAINAGAQTHNFNMALTDPINVLAGMSDGVLAPVTDLAAQASQNTQPAASQLVGNPNYGSWQTNSSGTSFWAWYGQYAFFSNLFSQPVRYGDWARNRPSSYYHDYGYNTYSSPKQKQQHQATEQKVRKKFASEGKKFQSPYASKTTTGGAKIAGGSKVNAPGKFQSAYGQKTTPTTNSNKSFSNNNNFSKNKGFNSNYAKPSKNNSNYNSRSFGTGGSRSFGSGGK